jgi:DNA invertase Pin-like site-specific DNA recombinase
VEIIDEDLGKSGADAFARGGFQYLLAEISLARAGLVLSYDASRLARNHRDWYQLLEVCSIFGTLIADGERLYDPRLYHDRLLLGLTGMRSLAELHQLKQRRQAGARHKAERGELRQGLPVGLARGPAGEVIFNPDEEVQARIRLVAGEISGHPLSRWRDAVSPSSAVAAALLSQSWPCSLRDRLATRTDLGHPRYTPPSGPMREPMSMDASSLSQRVAQERTQLAGGYSNLLTSGRCVYTRDIQHRSRGKNV